MNVKLQRMLQLTIKASLKIFMEDTRLFRSLAHKQGLEPGTQI